MKAVILCGGTAPSKELLVKALENCQLLICADSGANCLYEYNIKPHYIIGDLDSIKEEAKDYFKKEGIVIDSYAAEKDETDSELALNKAIQLGADEIIFLGCIGKRLDHVIGNLGLLRHCLKRMIKASIIDENNKIFMINTSSVINGEADMTFSLQAYGGDVKGLTIKGAKYPLYDYKLEEGNPITLSNKFISNEVKIEFMSGILLLFFSRD
jgi:thiamine pyrophosphokinase